MGIQGLLPLLKSITVTTHVKTYAQQTLGVDAYVWLHRGAFACAWDLALGKPTTKYVEYAMHRVRMLRHYGITPYVVFDGDYLPSKAKTEIEREIKRSENTRLGKESMARGQTKMAQEYFQKAIDITPDMALRFIKALQNENIEYVVAPYEADAQLAYLERVGLIDGIVTEDSDLLVFGCKKVLFKMNEFGECMEIDRARFGNNTGMPLAGWNDDMFRYMAILSGCDYLASIPGMGLKTAHRLVRKYKNLDSIFKALYRELGTKMPSDYEEKFRRADSTFLFQRVFCPLKQTIIMGHQVPDPFSLDDETLELIGAALPDDLARAVADGSVDPITKQVIVLSDGQAWKAETGKRPGLRHSQSAPPGNMLMDAFLKPKRPVSAVLAPVDTNVQSLKPLADPASKRVGPRPSLREQAQAKKLKLFESSPSPPARAVGRFVQDDKENEISPFFTPKKSLTKKESQADQELEQALRASMREEEKRKEFEGFENPIGFEVQSSLRDARPKETPIFSEHFSHSSQPIRPASIARRQSSDLDSIKSIGLPTPPTSQNNDLLVAGWKERYSLSQTATGFSSSQARPSTSLERMAGKVLSRQASLPDLLGTRRPTRPRQYP